MRYVLICVLVLVSTSDAIASSVVDEIAQIDAKRKSCMVKDDSNTGMKICTNDALALADAVLTRVYKRFVSSLKAADPSKDPGRSKEQLARLVGSERAWIAYRDNECRLESASMLEGSGEGLLYSDCMLALTKDRAKSLTESLANFGS